MIWSKKLAPYLKAFVVFTFVIGVSPLAIAASNNFKAPDVAKGGKAGEIQDQILVKFKDKANPMAKDKLMFKHQLSEKSEIKPLGIKIMKISPNDTPQEVVDRLKAQDPDSIEFAEVDALIEPDATVNDPAFSSQWHVTKIEAPSAWDSTKGSPVTVAVLDTGVDCTHPDLIANCVNGWNTNSNNSDTTDIYGHGTKVAGTVAESGDNALGSAGIAFQTKIMPIRISNDAASGIGSISAIATGITYAADHGAKIATNSYQTTDNATVQSAANYMRSKGGIFIASSGNGSALLTAAEVPAVVTVGATDSNDNRASWSNYGAEVDVTAPGVSVYTTVKGGGYGYVSGTSFSAPSTAAVFALIFAANPSLTPDQAESILKSTAKDLGDAGWDQYYGWGRVNAAAAVALAKSSTGNLDTTPPSVPANLVTTSVSSTGVSLSWTASIDLVGVAGYKVFRDGVQVGISTTASYNDSKIVSGSTYNYTVAAYDAANNVSGLSNAVTAVIPQAPVVVSILSYSVTNKTTSTAAITWTTSIPSTGVISYGSSKASLSLSATDNVQGTTHTVTLNGLSKFTTYYYRVTAISGDGSSSASTPVSNFKTMRK